MLGAQRPNPFDRLYGLFPTRSFRGHQLGDGFIMTGDSNFLPLRDSTDQFRKFVLRFGKSHCDNGHCHPPIPDIM